MPKNSDYILHEDGSITASGDKHNPKNILSIRKLYDISRHLYCICVQEVDTCPETKTDALEFKSQEDRDYIFNKIKELNSDVRIIE